MPPSQRARRVGSGSVFLATSQYNLLECCPSAIKHALVTLLRRGAECYLDLSRISTDAGWTTVPLKRGELQNCIGSASHRRFYHGTRYVANVCAILMQSKGRLCPGTGEHSQAGKPARNNTPAVWFAPRWETCVFYTRPPVRFIWSLTSRQAPKHSVTAYWTLDFDGIALECLHMQVV